MNQTHRAAPRTERAGGSNRERKLRQDRAQLEQHPVSLRRIGALFAPHRATLIVVVLLIVASSLIGLAQPFIVRELIDHAIPQQDVRALVLGAAGLVGVAVITALFGVIQTWRATLMGQKVMHGLRTSLFSHLQRQSLAFFTRSRSRRCSPGSLTTWARCSPWSPTRRPPSPPT